MKKISIQVNLILLLSALASNVSFGQTYPFSEERYNYPVRTDATNPPIKVLVIPVQLNGINSSGQSCDGWVTTCFPENGIPVDIDKYFDNSIGVGGPVGYFTKYYYDASFGNFVVLGDYLDVVVNLPYCGSSNVGGKVMKLLYDTYGLNLPLHYNSPLSDFDKYTLDAPQVQGYPKVVAPNLRFDHVIFLIRNNPEWGSAVGFGCAETSILPGDPVSGFGPYGVDVGCAFGHNGGIVSIDFVLSEYFHALYGHNNWHLGSGASYHTFMSTTQPWGLTSQLQGSGMSNVVSAWDRWSTTTGIQTKRITPCHIT